MALSFQCHEEAGTTSGGARRIALFPGAWNPPTVAHLAIARAALDHAAQVVWLLPRAFPHKVFDGADFNQRREMLCEVTRSERRFSVAISNGGLYLEMADEARQYFGPEPEIGLLCGRDAAERIANWKYDRPDAFDAMVDRYPLLVAGRSGDYLPHARHAERVIPVRMGGEFDEVSSTEIRTLIGAGRPWQHLVPKSIGDAAARIYGPRV